MAESMIERVAQALAKESGVSNWAHVSEHGEYDSRDYWRRLARASFVAMRDFTEEMEARSVGLDGRESLYISHDSTAEEVWQWVIDQALDGA